MIEYLLTLQEFAFESSDGKIGPNMDSQAASVPALVGVPAGGLLTKSIQESGRLKPPVGVDRAQHCFLLAPTQKRCTFCVEYT